MARSSGNIRSQLQECLALGPFCPPSGFGFTAFPALPEAELADTAGAKIGGLTWRRIEIDSYKHFNLRGLPGGERNWCGAYLLCWIESPRAMDADFHFEVNQSLAIWANGRQVFEHRRFDYWDPKGNTVSFRLQKGSNALLLKVGNEGGRGWGFSGFFMTSAGISISAKPPRSKKAKKLDLAGLDLVPVGTDLAEGGGGLIVHCYNPNAKRVGGVKASIEGFKSEAASVEPLGFASLVVPADARSLAAGAAVSITWGKKNISPVISAKVLLRLLGELVTANGSEGERKALDGASRAISLFSVSVDELREELSAALKTPSAEAIQRLEQAALARVPDRKADRATVVGHAHIDMNWLWTYRETKQSCQDSFRQVIAFMEEFPDFVFLQSQPSCYAVVEEIDPPLFERIRSRVAEGRWELAGGMYTEGDTNLSSGEALARTFLLGQRYFMSRFGKTAVVGWLPDNFGHVSQLPQIMRLADCRYFYFHRCRPHYGNFWWEGTDGSRVLCFTNDSYNGVVSGDIVKQIDRYSPRTGQTLLVCGVGDHGGGPTRRDLEEAARLDAQPKFPSVKLGAAEGFFRQAESRGEEYPLHKGEMQFVFEGCYTSIARVKAGNRACENALYSAEVLSSLASLAGVPYPADALRESWRVVAFNQFHDILCGSAIHESNQESVADYTRALAAARDVTDRRMRELADEIAIEDRSAGTPVVVINPQPRERKALVTAEVFSHDAPASASLSGWGSWYARREVAEVKDAGQGAPVASVMLRDSKGKQIPAQVVGGQSFPPGWRWRVAFSDDLPAGGYKTYFVDPADPAPGLSPIPEKKGVFETEAFKVAFDLATGDLKGVFDKRLGRELVAKGGVANRLRIYKEVPHGMSAWNIGAFSGIEDVTETESVEVTERGPVRACVKAVKRWGRSKFVVRTYIYRDYPRIDFDVEAQWFEQGTPTEDGPMLRAVFPLNMKSPRFDCHVPFDVVSRPTDGREVPAQQWVDASADGFGVAVLNDSKYGHSLDGSELRLTLLRSSYDPDIYPDQGLHYIRYSLFPHAGDWREGGVWAEGEDVNVPAMAVEPPSFALVKTHATRPMTDSLVRLMPETVALTGLKEHEEGGELVARLAEVEGRETLATLTLPVELASARRLDLLERPLEGVVGPKVEGRAVTVTLKPHEIVTIGLRRR